MMTKWWRDEMVYMNRVAEEGCSVSDTGTGEWQVATGNQPDSDGLTGKEGCTVGGTVVHRALFHDECSHVQDVFPSLEFKHPKRTLPKTCSQGRFRRRPAIRTLPFIPLHSSPTFNSPHASPPTYPLPPCSLPPPAVLSSLASPSPGTGICERSGVRAP